jgi:hypothetical protein
MTLTEEEYKKTKEIQQKLEQEAIEIIKTFLNENSNTIVDTTIQYTKQCGTGALFITLLPNSREADIEYFKVEDLDGNFQRKILDSPHKETSIFYAVKLSNYSYIFERNLGEKIENYIM